MKYLVRLALASRTEATEILQQPCFAATRSLWLRQLVPWSMVGPYCRAGPQELQTLPLMSMQSEEPNPLFPEQSSKCTGLAAFQTFPRGYAAPTSPSGLPGTSDLCFQTLTISLLFPSTPSRAAPPVSAMLSPSTAHPWVSAMPSPNIAHIISFPTLQPLLS